MKARFKIVMLSALGALTAFTAVTFSSCKEDKCKAIVCAYGGVCTDGMCLCPSGYEGNQCETITRTRYLGVWHVTEDGTYSDAAQYSIAVEAGPNITELRIRNFRNSFLEDVQAFVKGDSLTIPNQIINNKTVRGFGYIVDDQFYGANGKIIIRYLVRDQNGITDDYGVDGGDASLWNK
ncbi:MAG TPA: hypothetical protein PL009_09680 [Flavipsychrobacter sp.]|nr:hypothetical protein [Flavipsychrobacter sp.]